MRIKILTLAISFCFLGGAVIAQQNQLLINYTDGKTSAIKKGDLVRLAYPSAKINLNTTKKLPVLLGFKGKVDSLSADRIWLKVDKRTNKRLDFAVNDIAAIKEVSKSSELLTFIGSFVVIGAASAAVIASLDVNDAAPAFAAAFALFPAAIVTANIFYPTKPKHKVGDGYSIKVITLN
jgi:hypothetical protein